MSDSDIFESWGENLQDFWGRRDSAPTFRRSFHLFGWPVQLTSNLEVVLQAVDASLPLFSRAPARLGKTLHVHVIVREMPDDPGPVPEDLFTRIQYSGYENWLAMHLGPWGLAHMAIDEGRAIVVIAPSLAAAPGRLSRYVLNTIFLNLLENRGFSMLHATSLVRHSRAILLLGEHNSGKSSTALHLALSGYEFVADSMIFVSPVAGNMELLGFPVGLAKVRHEMLQAFPQIEPLFEREITREEIKFGVDLRRLPGVTVREEAIITPFAIDLFLLERHEGRETLFSPAGREETMRAIFRNSAYWHSAAFWQQHLARLERLLEVARCRHLLLGSDVGSLLAALEG